MIRHSKLVLVIVAITTVLSLILLPRLKLNGEYINLLPPKPEHVTLKQEVLGMEEDQSADLFGMVQGPSVFSPQALEKIESVLGKLENHPELTKPFSAFDFITVQKKGTRLMSIPLARQSVDGQWSAEEADRFVQCLAADDIAQNLLTTDSKDAFLFQFSTKANGTDQEALHQDISSIVSQLKSEGKVFLIGTPLFEDRVLFYLSHDMKWLLTLCLLVIVMIFYLAFRTVRAIFIPFSLSIIAIIWTLGAMALFGYSLTVVNIIIPSMVLILGSSYSIHVLSEYYRHLDISASGKDQIGQIEAAVRKISTTIFGACLTTIVGFLSLLICKLEAFRELGISVSLGIFFCAVLSLVYIPACLSLLPAPKPSRVRNFTHGPIARMVHCMSLAVVRRWRIFASLFILTLITFLFVHDSVHVQTDYLTYFPKDDKLIQDSVEFARLIGGSDAHYITLNSSTNEKDFFLKPEVLKQVYQFEERLKATNADITSLFSFSQYVAFLNKVYQGREEIPDTPGLLLMLSRMLKVMRGQNDQPLLRSLINEDGNQMTITVRSYDSRYQSWESLESVRNLQLSIEQERSLLPSEIRIDDWGVGVDALRMSEAIKGDQRRSLLLSLVLVFFIVLVSFRSVAYGIYALIPTLTGIMGNYIFMYLLDIPFDVITIIFASVTIGIGVDAAIHFLLRFRIRRREHPQLPFSVAVAQTLEETGRPILLTATAIVLGLLVLMFASFLPVKYFGLLLAFALCVTTLATLLILPSVLLAVHTARKVIATRYRKH